MVGFYYICYKRKAGTAAVAATPYATENTNIDEDQLAESGLEKELSEMQRQPVAQQQQQQLVQPAKAASNFCSKCGTKNEGGYPFCGKCGNKLL